jgi:hypothetical protein
MITKTTKNMKASMKASKSKKSSTSSRVMNPVIQMNVRGRKIKKYKSISEASLVTGVNTGSISKVVRGIGSTAGGFRWANA